MFASVTRGDVFVAVVHFSSCILCCRLLLLLLLPLLGDAVETCGGGGADIVGIIMGIGAMYDRLYNVGTYDDIVLIRGIVDSGDICCCCCCCCCC